MAPVLLNPSRFGNPASSTAYWAAVAADSPWGGWKTDETSGTTLADMSGNSRPLSTVNSPTLAQSGPTGLNDAISFTSTANQRAQSTVTTNATVFTQEAWVYLTAAPAARTIIIGRGNTPGGSVATDGNLYIEPDGKVNWHVYNGANQVIAAPSALTLNTWHHIAASVGAAGTRIRIDKTTVASNAGVTNGFGGVGQLILVRGGESAYNGSAPMKIARPAYYTTQLSNTRTDAHYDAA